MMRRTVREILAPGGMPGLRMLSARTSRSLPLVLAFLTMALLVTSGATGASSNSSSTLDQCANGGPGSTVCTDWVSGNLGASKAGYLEGDSVPYRLRMLNLKAGSHTATIEWDTTKGGKHAIDYITSWDRTVK